MEKETPSTQKDKKKQLPILSTLKEKKKKPHQLTRWNDEAHTIDRGITKNADTLRPVNENTTYHKPVQVIGNNPKSGHDFALAELSAPSWQAACKIFPFSKSSIPPRFRFSQCCPLHREL